VILTTFDDADAELIDTTEATRCSSEVSALINHYRAFSNTLQANSAVGVVQPVTRDSSAAEVTEGQVKNDYPAEKTSQKSEHNFGPSLVSTKIGPDPGKQKTVRTLVAMPAFNEESQIAKTIIGSKKYADAVLVVDDGSTDATVEIAGALGAIVIRHEVNSGYGCALQTIFRSARDLGVEELVILDSDGQHNPHEIPLLLNKLREGYDVVIGSRFIPGMESCTMPAYRKFGMKFLDTATIMAGGDRDISDTQSGFRAYNRRAVDKIKINGTGMCAGSEILIRVDEHGLRVGEVPINVRYDLPNTSTHHPVKHGIRILGKLVGIVGYKRPLLSFGLPGTIFVVLGLVFGSWAFAEYYLTSRFPFSLSMVSVLLLIMGMLLVTTAFILNSLIQIVKMEQ